MLEALKLFLPVFIPSWRFFDVIAPSPRIEFSLLKTKQEKPTDWCEFRARPQQLSFGAMIWHMFWNPRWNESLFLVTCAERLMAEPQHTSHEEILQRIKADLKSHSVNLEARPYLQFRVIFVSRVGGELQKHVAFTSGVHSCLQGVN